MKRVVIIGSSCSGKTTLAKSLAASLGVKHVELDSLYWNPGWVASDIDVFRTRVQEALIGDTWVVDGNYSCAKELIWSRADTVIWLDISLQTILSRFFARSLKRAFTREVLWNGCRENLRNSIFQRNSLLAWILKTHSRRKDEYLKLCTGSEHAGLRFHRIRSPREADELIHALRPSVFKSSR